MKTSPRGVAEIAGHEGIVLSPYRDSAGVWTFGVGHTAGAGQPNPAQMPRGEKQPLNMALELFRADLAAVEDRVNRAVQVPLAQHEFDALVSFDFNTGGIFRAKLTKRLNEGDRAGAIEGFDGWHRPPEIIGRRNAEKALFASGTYAHNGMATVFEAGADGRVDWSSGQRVNVLALMEPAAPPPADDAFMEDNDDRSHIGRQIALGAAVVALAALAWQFRGKIAAAFKEAPLWGKAAMIGVPVAALAAAVVWAF